MEKFGVRLKSLRKEHKLRQKDLAQALGLAQTTIANYEMNIRFPNEEILKKLSEYFNVSYDYLLGRNNLFYEVKPPFIPPKKLDHNEAYLSDLYKRYLMHLLNGKKKLATDLMIHSAKSGIDIRDIYLHILDPSLKEVGRLWELGRITVADEHYFSFITQHVMSLLHPYSDISPKVNRSILTLSAGSEQHNIGIRMVTDFFEMDGWDTYFLGSNTPTKSIIAFIKKYSIDIMAISCTMNYHVNSVENIIDTIRRNDDCKTVKIMVGGSGFYHDPNLWRKIGADGFGYDAKEALIQGNNLVVRKKSNRLPNEIE
ncbi:MAG: hypothetical protein CVU84_09605 [Firmicutes bacterium HGW-Firmicutes-1]|jgi:methanogenic corrinoid protein MtbC1/DNA-binding Xre family transcriptional regulator|nr:MAG: hypothetical protein CVU84_09605 [Firmicutes bacterium HGW-Firmicutes-1]